jgi:hypothetical protein
MDGWMEFKFHPKVWNFSLHQVVLPVLTNIRHYFYKGRIAGV